MMVMRGDVDDVMLIFIFIDYNFLFIGERPKVLFIDTRMGKEEHWNEQMEKEKKTILPAYQSYITYYYLPFSKYSPPVGPHKLYYDKLLTLIKEWAFSSP